ncbi:Crp/Fnr family transcriptional regulator [Rubrivivax sp. RP6-9]|uniref:Crp/Fnr family transcriptional regulator n=1 Tax=Rubrivivax sp. RP6-9 TaxID=3415750 RepID=UPI003CC5DB46
MLSAAWQHAWSLALALLDSAQGIVALVSVVLAGALVLAATFVRTMIPLRWLAVGSNVAFLVYAALAPSLQLLVLHLLLLPINLWRVAEMVRLTRRVKAAAAASDVSGLWLRPYMRSRRRPKGHVLFRQGEVADHLYLLASGRVELEEIGVAIEPGRVFGEIAFFSPDHRRTFTARCVTPCQVLSIDETTVRQLYHQNPQFGFELVGLVAGRLSADVQRLERKLRDDAAAAAAPSA